MVNGTNKYKVLLMQNSSSQLLGSTHAALKHCTSVYLTRLQLHQLLPVKSIEQSKLFDAIDVGNAIKHTLRWLAINANCHDSIFARLRAADSHEADVDLSLGQRLAHCCNEARSVRLENKQHSALQEANIAQLTA